MSRFKRKYKTYGRFSKEEIEEFLLKRNDLMETEKTEMAYGEGLSEGIIKGMQLAGDIGVREEIDNEAARLLREHKFLWFLSPWKRTRKELKEMDRLIAEHGLMFPGTDPLLAIAKHIKKRKVATR